MANRVLVVDDEQIIRESLAFVLANEGFEVEQAANGSDGYAKFQSHPFDIVITDLEMPVMKGIDLLEKVRELNPSVCVLVVTAYGSLETAVAALRKGASDYLLKPIEFDELLFKVRRLSEHRKLFLENEILRTQLHREYDFGNIIGKSPAMQRVFDLIKTVACTDSTVLITGRSGTGKELVARAIHFNSARSSNPFVAVNCGAIPESIIESELFGHRKGAFTGAIADKEGYFKAADGGTLFLDEISEMPHPIQVKILRAIEQREVTPVGSSRPIDVNVRIVTSTNRNLFEEVKAGRFREDLFYRINVVEIKLPSLSERRDDIPLLVNYFVEKYRKEMKKELIGLEPKAMHLLMQNEWKGEVRELENVVERAVIFSKGEYVTAQELRQMADFSAILDDSDEEMTLQEALREIERKFICRALESHAFHKERTAQTLGISLPTLYRRLKVLGISRRGKNSIAAR